MMVASRAPCLTATAGAKALRGYCHHSNSLIWSLCCRFASACSRHKSCLSQGCVFLRATESAGSSPGLWLGCNSPMSSMRLFPAPAVEIISSVHGALVTLVCTSERWQLCCLEVGWASGISVCIYNCAVPRGRRQLAAAVGGTEPRTLVPALQPATVNQHAEI